MALVNPVEKDGFSYAGDSLYCEASNLNRHRRATLPELKAHFAGKDTENRPAHWYEAQLLHYGLPPSKTKGTAHKRLFDAVIKGGLDVPAYIKKIEADLKKEWNKKDREAKKVLRESAVVPSSSKGSKRKADQVSTNVSVSVSVQVSSNGSVKVQAAQPKAKKAKTTKTAPAATKVKEKVTKSANSRTTTTGPNQKKTPAAKPAPAPKPAGSPSKPKASAKRTPQRPSFSNAGMSGYASGGSGADYGEQPPPYSEFDVGHGSSSQERQQSSPQPKLGLLNGRYRVSCPDIEDDYPEFMNDFGLIATLDGNNLWLKFDFGAMTGMIKILRPFEASQEHYSMFWRGYHIHGSTNRQFVNIDTVRRAGPVNYLVFLGGGHIHGSLCVNTSSSPINFDAYRLTGQSMTSEISPTEARAEWTRLEQNMDMSW